MIPIPDRPDNGRAGAHRLARKHTLEQVEAGTRLRRWECACGWQTLYWEDFNQCARELEKHLALTNEHVVPADLEATR